MIGLARTLFAKPLTRAFGGAIGLVLIIFALFWVHFFNQFGIDDWLERRFLQYASPSVNVDQATDVRIVRIRQENGELGEFAHDSVDNAAWRDEHALLLRKLAAADGVGARVVAFDLYFSSAGTEFDAATAALLSEIANVQETGRTKIVLGYNRRRRTDESLAAALRESELGLVNIRRSTSNITGDNYLTRVLLAEVAITQTAVGNQERVVSPLPLPLAIFVASQQQEKGPALVQVDALRGELTLTWERAEPTVIAVEIESCLPAGCADQDEDEFAGATLIHRASLPFWVRSASTFDVQSYSDVLASGELGRDYADRVVIVGAETDEEKIALGPGAPSDTIYAYHVLARVVADLLHDTYPRRAGAALQLAVIVILVLSGSVARRYLPIETIKVPLPLVKDTPLPVGVAIVGAAYLLLAFGVFRAQYLLFDLAYHALALAGGYYVVPALMKRRIGRPP